MTPVGGNVKVWTGRGVGGATVVVVVVGAAVGAQLYSLP